SYHSPLMLLRSSLRLTSLALLPFFVFESSIADDTDRNFTNAGKIGLTITNYGTIGTRNAYWPSQPSCEYPIGSRIEHLYQGGLWVGALSRTSGQLHVSAGAHDRLFTGTPLIRPEMASDAGADMVQRSSLQESRYFDEHAISHQDFLSTFTDSYKRNPTTGDTIPEHVPLNIRIRQESYAWNFPFADFFVILNYTIYNAGVDTLDSVYVGFWNNGVVRNTNNVRPGTPEYFNHGANGFMDTLRLMYTFDFDGIPTPPPTDSYVGVKLLGASPFPRGVDSVGNLMFQSFFNGWRFRTSSGEPAYFSPADDAENIGGARSRYSRLAASLPNTPPNNFIDQLRTRADNVTTLLSTGPFSSLNPGDSLNIVFGVICARKFGTGPAANDTRTQRKTLISNAGLCQQAYDGEDVNGDNRLQPGEDLNGNGILDHYLLPQPPRSPKVHVEVGNQSAAIYWDKSTAELSVDPITHRLDFEGYRVYRSNAGADFTSPEDLLLTLTLAGEFDLVDSIGYNTGFSRILLTAPKYFPGDSVAYWYQFPPPGSDSVYHLNGWQYLYGVAAFDQGDSVAGIVSLQSKVEIRRVIPGTPATSDANKKVGVYPNPYYANAVWDGSGERNRKIYFFNLPEQCEIRVYTLAGDVVADMVHDALTYDGSNISWFQRFGNSGTAPQFAGGEHAWDLITKFDQAIATGLYLFSVKDSKTGDIKTGKFLVIK
ncbi:MAG: hypothetical protein HW412_405, partial [Bacteroidetes bacterium]|nr:hypothetical protein [Bacteroidota bacterium]